MGVGFFTIGESHGNRRTYAGMYGNQVQNFSEGIQSITLDLTDLNLNTFNNGSNGTAMSLTPTLNILDFATLDYDTEFVDIDLGSYDHSHFRATYDLVRNSVDLIHHPVTIGQLKLGSYESSTTEEDGFGFIEGSLNGNYNPQENYSDIEARLTNLSVTGHAQGRGYSTYRRSFSHGLGGASDIIPGQEYTENWGSTLPQIDWEKFADLELINIDAVLGGTLSDFEISTILETDSSIALNYNLYRQSEFLTNSIEANPLKQLAVLGDSVSNSSKYILDINAESLEKNWNIESTDITIKFDPTLFGNINASDIQIGGALPLANAVHIDNELGTIRIAAASLSDLNEGKGIYESEALASISLDFNEEKIQDLDKNPDGSLIISPLTFDISVNVDETIFSNEYKDENGLINREIVSMEELGGSAVVDGQEVTLYEAKINLEQQGDGLVLGTKRVIGSDASYTNLVRKGDTLTTDATWLNVGNIEANNLTYSAITNENALLIGGLFSKTNLASGSFIDGIFVTDARESTVFTADVEITGDAGNVVDMSEGIVAINALGTTEVFDNKGQGSSNLITFQGDLNYDGRVSMKDLAYLNAGAARQQLVQSTDEDGNSIQVASEASYARDVDADFSGKIDLADLSILDADWGKSLHTGDEQFQGSNDVSWSELDNQGVSSEWDNDSFKDQNAIEADADYVGSLESPTSNSIGADGNDTVGDGGIQGEGFQDPLTT
tara:strand:- start:496 stop:2673 length:2178 start_codon:yes stop_codon:yes gene_type:complete